MFLIGNLSDFTHSFSFYFIFSLYTFFIIQIFSKEKKMNRILSLLPRAIFSPQQSSGYKCDMSADLNKKSNICGLDSSFLLFYIKAAVITAGL